MQALESNIKGVVGSCANGILLSNLENEYFNVTHSRLDYQSRGFKTLRGFLESIPNVVELIDRGSYTVVKISLNSTDPTCLSNIVALVSNTKIRKNVKQKIRQSAPQSRAGSALEGLRISVSNDLCRGPGPGVSLGFSKHQQGERGTVSRSDKENSGVPVSRAHGAGEDLACVWIAHPVVEFDAYRRQVRVVVVQASHAVVVAVHSPSSRLLADRPCIEVTRVVTLFPGDILLWQPPVPDQDRPPSTVDLSTVFPVVVLRRVGGARVQVRIKGLPVVLEVCCADLCAVPRSAATLVQLVRAVQTRETTVLSLALLPSNTDLWYLQDAAYTVLSSLEDGGALLESSTERGRFLSLGVLATLADRLAAGDTDEATRRAFLGHVAASVHRALAALVPAYERLRGGEEGLHQENHPLGLAYSAADCTGRVLLGPEALFSGVEGVAPVLLRLACRPAASGLALVCVDRPSLPQVSVEAQFPLAAVFVLSESFSRSACTNMDQLRFRTATLLAVPDLEDIATRLSLEPL